MPGVEVGAEHDDLVGLVGAGDVGDHVERVLVGIVEGVADVQFHPDRLPKLDQARNPAVVLHRHDRDRVRGLVGRVAAAGAAGEHGAAIAAAGLEQGGHALHPCTTACGRH